MRWIKRELNILKKNHLFRQFRTINSSCDSFVKFKNKQFIMLASNNYFGLNTNKEVISAVKKAATKYGSGNVASRLIVNLDLQDKLETVLARYKKCESAIVYSSGYATNLGVINSLVGKGDIILSDKLNHASIIDGCRLSKADISVYNHSDVKDIKNKLMAFKGKRILLVTDSIFSMDGDIAPLKEIIKLKKKYPFMLMVDDAHATGILNTNFKDIDIHMGTLSKTLASQGGYVAGGKELIDLLRNKSRAFIYSTGLSPLSAAAALASLEIVNQRGEKLRDSLLENAGYLRTGLNNLGFNIAEGKLQIIPVIIGNTKKTMKFQELLEKEGIFVTGIRPPTVPEGTSRLRIAVMATHTKKQLGKALAAFERVGVKLNIIRGQK